MKIQTNFLIEKNLYFLLSCRTRSILLGSILGDGSLKIAKAAKNANLQIRHSIKQKDYLLWKASEMSHHLSRPKSISEQINSSKTSVEYQPHKIRYCSKNLPSLTYLHHLVHKRKRICIKRKWLNLMDPLALTVWWCDDGSLIKNTRAGVFCTDGFLEKDVQVLQKYMKNIWKIETKIYSLNKIKKDGNERFRLYITSTNELKKFLKIIIPHIPVFSMLSKVLILYKDSELQQRWITEVAENSQFSYQDIQDLVKQRKLEYKAFQ